MALSSGTRLGPYEVVSLLGAGGMGEVYRARDPRLGREVAVKVLPTAVSADVERLRRFEQEARAAAGLNHPNILAVFDIGSEANTTFIVSELLDGTTLRNLLQRGPLPLKKATDYAVQIAFGLAAAHEKGIVHRDLKPENLFVTADGRIKILDFGLAKLAEQPPRDDDDASWPVTTAGLTSPGMVVGTAGYMAPEQVRGLAVDARTDLFALGCVLYEMLSGTRAFGGRTAADTLSAILNDEPPALTGPSSRIPPGADRIVRHCLEKDPTERFQSARDVVFALRDQASTSELLTPAVATFRARYRPWAIAGAVLGSLVIASTWIGLRDRATLPSSSSSSSTGPSRLVVLPFENLSRQPGDEWLASAFSDSLTLGLRDVENVVVVSRERLMELRSGQGSQTVDTSNAQQLSRLLDVRYYVTGTYQRVDDDVRVVARMVEAESGAIKVQESLTDRYANLLKIEDDLASRFAGALQDSPIARPPVPTASLTAYRAVAEANTLYLTGRYRETIQRLESAIAEDESYADAWALLGKSYARLVHNRELAVHESEARREYQQQALRAAQKAVALNPSLYESQIALALAYQAVERVEPWRIAAQSAIDLNPRLADGHVLMSDSYRNSPSYGCARQRDPVLAERHLRRALEIDPRSGVAYVAWINHLAWSGRESEALRVADEAQTLLPDNVGVLRARSVPLIWLGKADEAEQQLLTLSRASAASVQDEFIRGVIDILRGRQREAAARFEAVIQRGPLTLTEIDTARIYSQVGRFEEAARHLERAFTADATCATFVANSPAFAPYRDRPALRVLLEKYRRP